MPKTILICDDSNLARKQLVRSLPDNLDANILQAANGEEAINILTTQEVSLLFLDLNMPVMDGYDVLSTMKINKLNVPTLVVSGDVQQQARERVRSMGALEFIKKPIDASKLEKLVEALGFTISEASASPVDDVSIASRKEVLKGFDVNFRDVYQELANVSMGQAGDMLSRALGVFVTLPVPNVNLLEVSELQMALGLADDDQATAISQGFMARGIVGEAILLINDVSMESLAQLMDYSGDITDDIEREMVMDIGNILIGSFLRTFGKQLNLDFSQGHPNILGEHIRVNQLMHLRGNKKSRILAIEINYGIENTSISCYQLMLFTDDSIATLNDRVQYLTDND
jgi:chemotaxis protein CheY-P-specific phosphatase CheC